jgi:hypothetical protein
MRSLEAVIDEQLTCDTTLACHTFATEGSIWTPPSTASSVKPQLLLTTALGGAVRVSVLECSSTVVYTTPTTLRYIQFHHSSSGTDATTAACFVQCSSGSAVTVALSGSSSNNSTHSSSAIAVTGLAYELQHGSVQEVYDTDLDNMQQQQQQQQSLRSNIHGAAHTSVASHIVKSSSIQSAAAATAAAQRKAAQVGRYSSCDSPPPRQQPPDLSNEPLAAELLSQQWEAAAVGSDDDDAAYSALLSSQNSMSSELAAAAVDGAGGLELRSPPRSRAGTGLSSRGHTVASVGRIVVRTVSSTVAAVADADTVTGTVMSPQRCALVTQQSYSGSAALSLGESLPVRAATAPAAALAVAAATALAAEFVVPGTTENSVASSAQQHLQQLLEDDASSLGGAVSEIAMSEVRSSSASASNVLQRSSSTASATAAAAASAANSHPSRNKQQQQQQQRGLKRARYRSLCTTATRFEYNSMGERVRVQIPLAELEGYGGPREELRHSGKFSLARTPAPAVPAVSTVTCHIEALSATANVRQTNPALQQGLPRAFAQCWTAQGRDVSEGSSGSGISVKGKGDTATLAREALDVAEAVGVQSFAKALHAVYMHRYDKHTHCTLNCH